MANNYFINLCQQLFDGSDLISNIYRVFKFAFLFIDY